MPHEILISSSEKMEEFAISIAAELKTSDMIALHGDLGTGKSTFVRAAIRFLMQDPELIVPSPSFTLLQTYETESMKIVHADFYRLSDVEELDMIGWHSEIETAITFVEWPSQVADIMPEDVINITIKDGKDMNERIISIDTINHAFKNKIIFK